MTSVTYLRLGNGCAICNYLGPMANPTRGKAERANSAKSRDREMALELGAVVFHLLRGSRALAAIDERGLSLTQAKALLELGADPDPEPVSVNALAGALGLSLPSASRAVDALVRKDLVLRSEDPEDRRVRRLSLTSDGRRLVEEVFEARLDGLESFVGSLEPVERRPLEEALRRICERQPLADYLAERRGRGRRSR